MSEPARERQLLTPSQLNALARDLLEGQFTQVWVEGEISGFSRPASGHAYFTLKDGRAQVRCALFRQNAQRLRFAPRDGQLVQARGRVTLYEARGDYQLVLDHLEEAGEGALRRTLEELKARLAAEGLFDAERRRPLPAFPRRLGVLTSPTGAAVRDVRSVLARRFPLLPVDVLPVPVQGDGAAARIRAMLAAAAASGRYDVLLLTRGGGSLEDLWAFNEVDLVRAVAASPVPVVCAVGHETDFSLCDFAADLRAPTPSAAAGAQRADQAFLKLQALRPQLRLERGRARLDALHQRLDRRLRDALAVRAERASRLLRRVDQQHPRRRLEAQAHRLQLASQRLDALVARLVPARRQRLALAAGALSTLSPLATLARGYAIVQRADDGRVVRSPSQAVQGDLLLARLAEGQLRLRVD